MPLFLIENVFKGHFTNLHYKQKLTVYVIWRHVLTLANCALSCSGVFGFALRPRFFLV